METIYKPSSIYHEIELQYEDGSVVSTATLTEIEISLRNTATNETLATTYSLTGNTVTLVGNNSCAIFINTEDVALMNEGTFEAIITTQETDSRFTGNIRYRKGKVNAFILSL